MEARGTEARATAITGWLNAEADRGVKLEQSVGAPLSAVALFVAVSNYVVDAAPRPPDSAVLAGLAHDALFIWALLMLCGVVTTLAYALRILLDPQPAPLSPALVAGADAAALIAEAERLSLDHQARNARLMRARRGLALALAAMLLLLALQVGTAVWLEVVYGVIDPPAAP